jgi:hypothetical protein
MHAHCTIRIHEYKQKVAERERQHEGWLARMSTAKNAPVIPTRQQPLSAPDTPAKPPQPRPDTPMQNPDSSDPRTNPPSSDPTPYTSLDHKTLRAEQRVRAEAERVATAALRVEARQREKAQREAAKQAQADQKAAAVRVEKEKLQAKIAAKAQEDAERIAMARAKAGVAPLRSVGRYPEDNDRSDDLQVGSLVVGFKASPVTMGKLPNRDGASQATQSVPCSKCRIGHRSFGEWRKCNARAVTESGRCEDAFS